MVSKWNILQLGIKIRLKGKSDKDDVDGIIKEYLTDDNKVITGYAVIPINSSISLMALALGDDIRVLRQVTVKCPYCKKPFQVNIENKYKGAEAIPQGGEMPKDNGHNQSCPNTECERQLFIVYIE